MYLIESVSRENHTELIVFSRDKEGNKKKEIVRDFKPYLYMLENEATPDDYRITNVELGYTSINGEKLKKVFVKKSTDVVAIREQVTTHFEADILITQRYIIDKIGEINPYPLKVLYLDIETNSNSIFPDIKHPNQEVTCISMIDSFDNKITKLMLKNEDWTNEQLTNLTKIDCKIFNTEEDLLISFINNFKKYDVDIISGWNVVNFDLTYLIRRMKMLNVNYFRLSPLNSVYIDEKYEDVHIKGVILLDMMKSYMHFRRISNQGKAESYSLEFTSQEVLGEGKTERTQNFNEMWKNNPELLIKYNEKDVLLVKRINDKLNIIEFFNHIRCKSCSLFSQIFYTSFLIDGLLLNKVHNKVVLPSKKKYVDDKYMGAYVMMPTPGIYNNVMGLDLKALYPSIMTTFNISYETFNPNGEIKISDKIGFDKTTGIMPNLIEELSIERNAEKKKMKKAKSHDEWQIHYWKQYGLKVLGNSVYGYAGFPSSRLYKKEVAEAITMMGRRILKWSATVLKKYGYKIIYGDTDSVYLLSKKTALLQIIYEGECLIKKINDSYKIFINNFGFKQNDLEIEFEQIFKKIMFFKKKGSDEGAKKKYAYIRLWVKGENIGINELRFKGLQIRRSDSPKVARELQKSVIQQILLENKTKEEIVNYLRKLDKKIVTGKIPDDELGCPIEIKEYLSNYGRKIEKEDGASYMTGVPPIIFGARYANKYLGTRFVKGMKPKFIYVRSVPNGYPNTHVITFQNSIPKGFVPDYDRIRKSIFNDKLTEIFESAGFGKLPNINSSVKSLSDWSGGNI